MILQVVIIHLLVNYYVPAGHPSIFLYPAKLNLPRKKISWSKNAAIPSPSTWKAKTSPEKQGIISGKPWTSYFQCSGGKLKISGSTFKARGTFFACISFIFLPMFGIYTTPNTNSKSTWTTGVGSDEFPFGARPSGRCRISFQGSIVIQWLFLVPLKGGRWHIIPQLAVYTTYRRKFK